MVKPDRWALEKRIKSWRLQIFFRNFHPRVSSDRKHNEEKPLESFTHLYEQITYVPTFENIHCEIVLRKFKTM